MTKSEQPPPAPVLPRDATLIGLIALAAYLPALWTGFTSDDFFILGRVKQFGGLQHPLAYFSVLGFFEYYRPLTFVSHAIDWSLWGLNPVGFHLTSIVLHALNSVLVLKLSGRLAGRTAAIVAGLLFALHPASHEPVYWMAARFDLLATCLSLTALLVLGSAQRRFVLGVFVFGLALLAKESAIAVPVIVAAHDVLIRRLDWRRLVRRLVPMVVVAGAYGILRSQAGALEVAGGASRFPKLFMLAAMALGLLWFARARGPEGAADIGRIGRRAVAALMVAGAAVAALIVMPATSDWLRQKLGFASFSLFYLVSPLAVPAPPASWFDRPAVVTAEIELVAVLAAIGIALRSWRWLAARPPAMFLIAFVAAALVPVSSMTSGPRYLYLAVAGVSMLAGVVVQSLPPRLRTGAIAVVALLLALSLVQLAAAARSWKWAGDMTRDALTLMTPALQPCGTRDLVLLTTPVAIRGVYSNFNEAAFEVTSGCTPATFSTLLRVQYTDAHVDVTRRGDAIEWRVPDYAGNFVASSDLRVFDVPVVGDQALTIDSPIGVLESVVQGTTRVFRLRLKPSKTGARFFYYSDGAMRSVSPS